MSEAVAMSEAAAMSEARFSAELCDGHCGSRHASGWSFRAGLKRYRGKDCAKTSNALMGTPLAQLHRRDVWFADASALADGLSLRKAAARCGISRDTAFRWRHIALNASKGERHQRLLSHPKRQRHHQPLEALDGARQRRRDILPPELSRLAAHDRKSLRRHRCRHPHASPASRPNLKVEQSLVV